MLDGTTLVPCFWFLNAFLWKVLKIEHRGGSQIHTKSLNMEFSHGKQYKLVVISGSSKRSNLILSDPQSLLELTVQSCYSTRYYGISEPSPLFLIGINKKEEDVIRNRGSRPDDRKQGSGYPVDSKRLLRYKINWIENWKPFICYLPELSCKNDYQVKVQRIQMAIVNLEM